jgi:hypothetical protein
MTGGRISRKNYRNGDKQEKGTAGKMINRNEEQQEG